MRLWPAARRATARNEIWRGIYHSYDDVPASGPGHHFDDWTNELRDALVQVRVGDLPESFVLEHEALMMTIRLLSNCRRIVDFGGGLGDSYAYLGRVMPDINVQYEVIELPEIAAAGSEASPAIRFSDIVGEEHRGADVVFVKSALQYVRDYASTLRSLFALDPRVVILEKFSGVSSPSYASAQVNVAGSSIPYWFIGFDELFSIAASAQYDRALWRRLPRVYDQSAFPAERRMGQASTILFRRR